MNASQIREPVSFGKRTEPHTVTISRNGKSSHFTISPLVFSITLCLTAMFMVGYFAATAYLMFRDDLIEASYAHNARVKHQYEDRIAALRTKLDRITSRQLLDQQAIESRVSELVERQSRLGDRGGHINTLLEKARAKGISTTAQKNHKPDTKKTDPITTGSLNTAKPVNLASLSASFSLRGSLGADEKPANPTSADVLIQPTTTIVSNFYKGTAPQMTSSFTQSLFSEITEAMIEIDAHQRTEVDGMRIAASKKAQQIAGVLSSVGVTVPGAVKKQIGGPFEPLNQSTPFDLHLEALDQSLAALDKISATAKTMPLIRPARNASVSSRFGSRVDPFNGKMAMHSGIDFRAARGTPVYAAGNGLVTHASRKGGYGKMVEIVHASGYKTRYAHLGKVLVKPGQTIKSGELIGKVGSTGRSTGPHLHYEIRKGKEAVNPIGFLKAAKKLQTLL